MGSKEVKNTYFVQSLSTPIRSTLSSVSELSTPSSVGSAVRYYSDEDRHDCWEKLDKLIGSIDSSNRMHATLSLLGDLDKDLLETAEKCEYACNTSEEAICRIRFKLDDLVCTLHKYYETVDEVSDEIVRSAENICQILDSCEKTMTELSTRISSVKNNKSKNVKKTNADDDLPIRKTTDKFRTEFAKMILSKYGITNISESDLANYLLIYDYLVSKGYDESWINDRIELIFKNNLFDDIALTARYSSKDMGKCLEFLTKSLEAANPDSFKHMLNLDTLKNLDGSFNTAALHTYLEFLDAKDIKNVTEKEVNGFVDVAKRMKGAGASDDLILDSTDYYYNNERTALSSAHDLASHDGTSHRMCIDETINRFVRNRFLKLCEVDTEHSNRYLDVLYQNTTKEDRVQMLNYFQVVKQGKDVPVQDKVNFVLDFAKRYVGYEDIPGDHYTDSEGTPRQWQYTYFGEVCKDAQGGNKQGYAWCAMFVYWMLNKGGLLDGSVVPGVTPENAISEKYWAGCPGYKNEFRSAGIYENKSYKPFNGDLVLFREYYEDKVNTYHIGIVIGVDDDRIYTIEGNAAAPIFQTDDPAAELAEAERNGECLPDDGHHQIRIKSYPRNYGRIAGYCKMGGEEQSTRFIEDQRGNIIEGYDFRDILIACSDGFVPNDEG
ncbi:MAG: CHAP domain-containing protein [Clostridiales bacterium]|nr:CHAP domain-containing protein [Clostridiales bacterium]